MLIGYDCFQGQCFDSIVGNSNYHYMEIKNAKFDEIKIDENITQIYNKDKQEWGYDTVFDAKFQNNLEAGNASNNGIPIEKILFQKRRKDNMEWEDVAIFEYDTLQKVYEYLDKFVENDCLYEYCVVPLTQKVMGKRNIIEFTPEYEGIFLTDKDNNYQLLYNLDYGDIEYNNPSYLYEPMNGKYPIISYGELDYKKTPIKATVVTPNNEDNYYNNKISPSMEKNTRDKLIKFLKNHKPKIYRSSNGEYMMVGILGNPKFTPKNEYGGVIGDIHCDVVEIDDVNNESMKRNGFIEVK